MLARLPVYRLLPENDSVAFHLEDPQGSHIIPSIRLDDKLPREGTIWVGQEGSSLEGNGTANSADGLPILVLGVMRNQSKCYKSL
jgi:hypothetical protein